MAEKKVYERVYKKIEGDLMIYYDGRIFVGKTELKYIDEIVHLEVGQLKKIIKDVVADTKAGLWK